MARFDKYDSKDGGFRALLANDWQTEGDLETPFGMALNASGHAVAGPDNGNTKLAGLMIITKLANAGDVVDIMSDGEIVEFGGVAGTNYFVDPRDGTLTTSSALDTTGDGATDTNTIPVGHTVEADRLVVRVSRYGPGDL